MFSILNRALSWVIISFGNKFCLKKRSRLIKSLDNRFYAKFMQLEIGPLITKQCYLLSIKVIGIRPLAPVQNSVSLKLMQRKTLNFVINLPDVGNITK